MLGNGVWRDVNEHYVRFAYLQSTLQAAFFFGRKRMHWELCIDLTRFWRLAGKGRGYFAIHICQANNKVTLSSDLSPPSPNFNCNSDERELDGTTDEA